MQTEPVHSYCGGGDADFSSLSEAVACDSHVSSATPCPEREPSITLVPVAEDTVKNKGLYIQGPCIGEVKVCV